MRNTENECERSLWMCLGVLMLLTLGVWLLGGCESEAPGKTMSAANCIRAEKQHEAENWAEAHAPGPSKEDEQRIADVMSARAAQEQHELAQYAKFQFDQKLELAEASAPRIYVSSQEEADGVALGQINPERRRQTMALTGRSSHQSHAQVVPDATNTQDRLYVRNILDESANQLVTDSAEREQEGNANSAQRAPFGNPVPGKPGYVTGPVQPSAGYIDVRGYSPGAQVIDPYTGRPMRVP